MTTAPMSCATDDTTVDRDWFMDWLTESTSFVTMESSSPVGVESRNLSGRRSIFALRSRLMSCVSLWVITAMMRPWQ